MLREGLPKIIKALCWMHPQSVPIRVRSLCVSLIPDLLLCGYMEA